MSTDDDYADELAAVAARLPAVVRTEAPETVAAWLDEHAAADRGRWYRDAVVAALVAERYGAPVRESRPRQVVDRVAVELAVRGEPHRKLTRAEREAAVAALYGRTPMGTIATRVGCTLRTVQRVVARLRLDSGVA